MLDGRHPVGPWVRDRLEVTSTAQLFGTEALGHPARHLRDETKLCSFHEDALDAQVFEFPRRFRTSHRVWRQSCHAERLSARIRSSKSQSGRTTLKLLRRVPRDKAYGSPSGDQSGNRRIFGPASGFACGLGRGSSGHGLVVVADHEDQGEITGRSSTRQLPLVAPPGRVHVGLSNERSSDA